MSKIKLRKSQKKALTYALLITAVIFIISTSQPLGIVGAGEGYYVDSVSYVPVCSGSAGCEDGYKVSTIVTDVNPEKILITKDSENKDIPDFSIDLSVDKQTCKWKTLYDDDAAIYEWYVAELNRGITWWGSDADEALADGKAWCETHWKDADMIEDFKDNHDNLPSNFGSDGANYEVLGFTFPYELDGIYMCIVGRQVGTMGTYKDTPSVDIEAEVTMTPLEDMAPTTGRTTDPVKISYNGGTGSIVQTEFGAVRISTVTEKRCGLPNNIDVFRTVDKKWGLTEDSYYEAYTNYQGTYEGMKSRVDSLARRSITEFPGIGSEITRLFNYQINPQVDKILAGYSDDNVFTGEPIPGTNDGYIVQEFTDSDGLAAHMRVNFEVYADWVGVLQANGVPSITCPGAVVGSTGYVNEGPEFTVTNEGPGDGVFSVDFSCDGTADSVRPIGTDWISEGSSQSVGVPYSCDTSQGSEVANCVAVASSGGGQDSCDFNLDCKGWKPCPSGPVMCVGNVVMSCDDVGSYSIEKEICTGDDVCEDGRCVDPGVNDKDFKSDCAKLGLLGSAMQYLGFKDCGINQLLIMGILMIFGLFVLMTVLRVVT